MYKGFFFYFRKCLFKIVVMIFKKIFNEKCLIINLIKWWYVKEDKFFYGYVMWNGYSEWYGRIFKVLKIVFGVEIMKFCF